MVFPLPKKDPEKKHRSENADFEIPLNVIGGLPEYFLETCCCLHPESSSQHIHPSIQKCIRCWQRKLGILPSFPTFLGVTFFESQQNEELTSCDPTGTYNKSKVGSNRRQPHFLLSTKIICPTKPGEKPNTNIHPSLLPPPPKKKSRQPLFPRI